MLVYGCHFPHDNCAVLYDYGVVLTNCLLLFVPDAAASHTAEPTDGDDATQYVQHVH